MSKSSRSVSPYYNTGEVARRVADGQHRDVVGGMWDKIGRLQFDVMQEQGLAPHHKLLDIGCGALRGGIHFVRYLDAGNYFGMDISPSLLEAGYELELDEADRAKLPRDNLKSDSDFDFGIFRTKFDKAIALSVFTHLPFNHIRVCLERLAGVMKPGGIFHATFFEIPEDHTSGQPRRHTPGDVTTHGTSDPYHYRVSDFAHAIRSLPWTLQYFGDFGHARGQYLLMFVKHGNVDT